MLFKSHPFGGASSGLREPFVATAVPRLPLAEQCLTIWGRCRYSAGGLCQMATFSCAGTEFSARA